MYMLKAAIIQCLVLVCYRTLMHRDTFHRMVRFYFMYGIIFSYIAPFIRFDFRILPPLQNNVPQIFRNIQPVVIQDIPVVNPVVETPAWWTQYSFADILTVMLFAGMIIMLIRFVIQYLSLVFLKVSRKQKYKTYSILNTDVPIKPFSFGKRIYINPKLHDAKELDEIIRHELVHVHQYHSIDLIVSIINRSILWWNPFVWILSKDIRNNLEYIVDSEMLQHGFDRKHYQYHLLNISQLAYSNGMANYFNLSNLKKRIEMMNKEKTQSVHKMKWLLLVPVAALILLSFNVKRAIATNVNLAVISEMIEPEPLNDETVQKNDSVVMESKRAVRKNTTAIVSSGADTSTNLTGKKVSVTAFFVRGITFGADDKNAPLMLIDGVESSDDDLSRLSTDDVASFSIMKNATATTIYGERGANGVILVITKKGEKESSKSGTNLIDNINSIKHLDSQEIRELSESEVKNLRLRGGDNPLVIIDEKESNQNELTKLEHNEIESISVLKNDAAVKYYGEKGKNGVIIVVSKKD
jgi:TonB-dependent SusC/RagA subfamily outer membrane receptor